MPTAQELVRYPVSAPPRAAEICILKRLQGGLCAGSTWGSSHLRGSSRLCPNSRASGSDRPVRCLQEQKGLSSKVTADTPILLAKEPKSRVSSGDQRWSQVNRTCINTHTLSHSHSHSHLGKNGYSNITLHTRTQSSPSVIRAT